MNNSQNNSNIRIKNAVNYLAEKMPSFNKNHFNPVETLSVEDITYLQAYLENIKCKKLAQHPKPSQTSPSQVTKMHKRTPSFKQSNNYYNPYECGARQNILEPINLPTYHGPYKNDSDMLQQMGITGSGKNPGHIRNADVESSLLQREITHLPGQREITEKNYNRFDLLPFDPQDANHIIWCDNMPRGGYPTRNERLEQ